MKKSKEKNSFWAKSAYEILMSPTLAELWRDYELVKKTADKLVFRKKPPQKKK